MNQKGFVLLETAVVLIVVVVAMLGLYSTYSFVFKSLKQSQKYDNINDVYKLNIFYGLMRDKGLPSVGNSGWLKITNSDCNSYFDDTNCASIMSDLRFDYFLYIGKDMDIVLINKIGLSNTDINYLKTLDYNYKYIIGAYQEDNNINNMHYVSLKVGETS